MQLRTILHPTDFSPYSEYAFYLACALARDHDARILVLHVTPPIIVYGEMGATLLKPEGHKEPLREKLRQIQPPDPTVPVEYRLEEGEAAAVIPHVAEEIACDLIVMGTHGRTGLRRLLMGSMAEQVIRVASCPVVTVKAPVPDAAPPQESGPTQS